MQTRIDELETYKDELKQKIKSLQEVYIVIYYSNLIKVEIIVIQSILKT